MLVLNLMPATCWDWGNKRLERTEKKNNNRWNILQIIRFIGNRSLT